MDKEFNDIAYLLKENARDKEKLHTLIDLIVMNTGYNWNNEITIKNDKSIIDYIKIIAYEKLQDHVEKINESNPVEPTNDTDDETVTKHIPNLL